MMAATAFIIAGAGWSPLAKVWLWVAVIMGAFIVFGAALYILRRMAVESPHRRGDELTMEQIDRLHSQGSLTEDEYRRARRSALGLTDPDTPEQ